VYVNTSVAGCTAFVSSSIITLLLFICIYLMMLSVAVMLSGAPCHHGMAHLQVVDGGDGLQIWRVAVNILNQKSPTADRE
jgi:hypothetical protein